LSALQNFSGRVPPENICYHLMAPVSTAH